MSSQNNQGKKSLAKISDYILNEQVEDIKAYTIGHLNENRLWKPTKHEARKEWDYKSLTFERRQKSDRLKKVPHLKYQFQINADDDENEIQDTKNDNMQLPVSNKEMSLKILSSHLSKGITKTEKLSNLVDFQKETISRGTTSKRLYKNCGSFVTIFDCLTRKISINIK